MKAPVPPSEPRLNADGTQRQSWTLYDSLLSTFVRDIPASSVDPATVTAAQSSATAAQTSANNALAQLATINSSPSLWTAGDYKPSAQALGTGWLACDGSDFSTATYPALAAVLSGITAPGGGGAGTQKLPSIAPVFDAAHPGPGGPAVLTWYVRAQ